MLGSRGRSRQRRTGDSPRWLRVTALFVAGLLVLSLGGSSISFTTADIDRDANVPVVQDSIDAVHGLNRTSSVPDATTSRLVNVSNNFGSDTSNAPELNYTVRILNHTADVGLEGSVSTNQTSFKLAPDEGTTQVNITASNIDSDITVKYAVNGTATATDASIQVNATRTVTVQNKTA